MRKLGVAVVFGLLAATTLGVLGGVAAAAPPPVTFAPKHDYLVGARALSVAVGDLNGDGFLDLVEANYILPGVSVGLGDGSGGFGARTDFAITGSSGGFALSVALGDLNGDGFLDVAVTVYNGVSVLLGDGAGGFRRADTDYATPTTSTSVAIGDLNGDGFLDLAVDSVPVAVLLGNGDGTFAPPDYVYFSGSGDRYSIAVGDLNDDGIADLVTAVYGSPSLGVPGSVSVLLGAPTGGFRAPISFDMSSGSRSVAVGDLNGDGFLDIAVTNSVSSTVSVRLGDGAGGFGARNDFGTGTFPYSVALGDLNGDGFLDIAAANHGSDFVQYQPSVSVLLGDGTGNFGMNTDFATGRSSEWVATGDFNGDSRLDLAVVNSDPTALSVSVLLNTTPPRTPGAPTIGTAAAGDAQATVSWTAPVATGGSPITGYTVTPYIGYWPLQPAMYNSTATAQVVTGLTNGTTYRFRVQAVNAIGTGPYSKVTNPITLPTSPGAPTIGTARAGDSQATVSWTAPVSDGGSPIIGYAVLAYIGYTPAKVRIFNSPLTTETVTGLTNGTEYRFRVLAYNAIGISDYSKVTNPVTPTA